MYCVVETLNKKTGNWDCFGVSTADRNYELFSRIADVRNSEHEDTYIEPIDNPRGWPGNVSEPAKTWEDYHASLPHSYTWLNRDELKSLNTWVKEQWSGDLWTMLRLKHLAYLFDFEKGWNKAAFKRYSDLRILFFFDN